MDLCFTKRRNVPIFPRARRVTHHNRRQMVCDGEYRRREPDVLEEGCRTPVFVAHTLSFSSSSSTAAVAVATSAVRGPSEYQSIDLPFSIVFPSFTIPSRQRARSPTSSILADQPTFVKSSHY